MYNMFDERAQLFNGLIELIEGWNPQIFSNEKDYQKSLYEYLSNLQDTGTIRKERRILRERGTNQADIVIDDIIAIEIKKDLKHQPEVDRCVAQIKRMKNEYNFVLVIIVGEYNNRQHITLLKHELNEFLKNDDIFGNEKMIKVIQVKTKREEDTKKKKENNPFGINPNLFKIDSNPFDIKDLF